jgi:predicted regulator of Ras-like GTPase activity (Roadblock/LC7/MglB family)
MPGLSEVVRSLSAREGVRAALLLSGDGLAIDHAAEGAFEAEAVAALGATLARFAAELGDGARLGAPHIAVLEYAEGLVVLAPASSGEWLAILARPDTDIGPLLFDLRQHRSALGALL